ncbi:4Fe-4S binding protein [Desulfobacter curvatus]|uniref:4Fe-4S binding protein n=1 Tax=Desulfobacter curvatus TaxID=2290 RepID=UPI0003732F84|nr:4Fe-4S binding protein [Desulfobacter curvatus]
MFNFTPSILKNLASRPATRQYPFAKRELPEGVRGELYNDIHACIFCGMCSRKCPTLCISVDKKAGTWTCDPFMCVYCGICADNCPTHCLHFHTAHRPAATERQMISMQGDPKAKKKNDTD